MSTLKIIDKHDRVLLTYYFKVFFSKKINKLVTLQRKEELEDNFGILIMLLFECIFVELFCQNL